MANTKIDGTSLPQATLDGFRADGARREQTTRNTIAGGMRALTEHCATGEAARRPCIAPQRGRGNVAVCQCHRLHATYRGGRREYQAEIAKGDKVVMWYGAANYDDDVFENPYEFDVSRANAREHLAFGIGQHFCIGSQLARMQIRVMYDEILSRFPDMHACGSYSYLRSNHLSGLKSMPVVFTPVT